MSCYKYSFRFNGAHDTSKDGSGGHNHSFEVVLYVRHEVNVPYHVKETEIKKYLERYKGKLLNELFDEVPTIEVIAQRIFSDIEGVVGKDHLVALEFSDAPTQVYRIEKYRWGV